MKRSPLHRRTPIRQRRATPRNRKTVVRLCGDAMEQLRWRVYRRDGGRCTACDKPVPLYGSVFTRGHLAHIKSRGAGGSDTAENTRLRCFHCHIELEHTKGIEL